MPHSAMKPIYAIHVTDAFADSKTTPVRILAHSPIPAGLGFGIGGTCLGGGFRGPMISIREPNRPLGFSAVSPSGPARCHRRRQDDDYAEPPAAPPEPTASPKTASASFFCHLGSLPAHPGYYGATWLKGPQPYWKRPRGLIVARQATARIPLSGYRCVFLRHVRGVL